MTLLMALLIIVAAIWLLGRIRLGGLVQYDEDGLLVKVLAGPLKITLLPRKELSVEEQEKRKAKARVKKAKAAQNKAKSDAKKAAEKAAREAKWREKHPGQEPPQPKKGGALPPFTKLLPLVAEAAGGLKKLPRIDELTLHITWASEDPMETALGYGRANAALGMIWPLIDHNFVIKKHDLGISVDFTATAPTVMCRAAITTRLGQLTCFGLRLAFRFLGVMIRHKAESKEKNRSTKKQEA